MAMMASATTGNFYDDDNAVLDDDFLNDGAMLWESVIGAVTDAPQKLNQTSLPPRTELP
jgi:hypothetical protein